MAGEHTGEIHKLELQVGQLAHQVGTLDGDLREFRQLQLRIDEDRQNRAVDLARLEAQVKQNTELLQEIRGIVKNPRNGNPHTKIHKRPEVAAGGTAAGVIAVVELIRALIP